MAKEPPVAPRREFKTIDGRTDYYHWLRDPKWPVIQDKDILDYLSKENDYTRAHLPKEFEDQIFEELKGRIKDFDETVPYLDGDYYYWSYITKEQEYWVHARRKKEDNKDKKEILIDENQLAKDKMFFNLEKLCVTPDHKKIVYAVDSTGGQRTTVYVKDLQTNEIVDSVVDNVLFGLFEIDELNEGFFYCNTNEFLQTDKICYHRFGTERKDDKVVYQEHDNTIKLTLSKSSSKNYIFINADTYEWKEKYFIDSKKPLEAPKLLLDRSNRNFFKVAHSGNFFYLCINDSCTNFRVVRVPVNNVGRENWQEVRAASDYYMKDIFAYKDHLVLLKKFEGLVRVEILNLKDGTSREIKIEDEAYDLTVVQNTFEDKALRYMYSSLKMPISTIDHDFSTGKEKVLKVQEIPSGFDSSNYTLKRIWIDAHDQEKIPVTLIYNKNKAQLNGSDPLVLYGYGCYGSGVRVNFRHNIFTLVDRGFTYAIAHVRGGDELGKFWHEEAKYLTKKRTFTDFIDVAERLIEMKYTGKGNISIMSKSAGGLLAGYCLNNRPELFKAALMSVPFVDLMNSMLDESLPLTPSEFKEWGDPKDKKFYDYMLSYSPYDNIKAQNYPSILVTSALSDIMVTYWEPLKFVAALRHSKLDNNILLLYTDMTSGHAGPSGRFSYLRDYAMEYAFLLGLYGFK